MTRKEEILEDIKRRHKEELKRADKFLDLKFSYPFQSRIEYKGQFYFITNINMINYDFEATPDCFGEAIDLMTVDLSEISSAPYNVAEG